MGMFSYTRGMASPVCIRSSTFKRSFLPIVPPGWREAKSSILKFLFSIRAIESASPRARVAVVLDVGTILKGHASSTLTSRTVSP